MHCFFLSGRSLPISNTRVFTALHACRPSGYPACAVVFIVLPKHSHTDQSIPHFENNTPSDPCLGIGSVVFRVNCVCSCGCIGGWDRNEKHHQTTWQLGRYPSYTPNVAGLGVRGFRLRAARSRPSERLVDL